MKHKGDDETKDYAGFLNFIGQYILSLQIKNHKKKKNYYKTPFKYISVTTNMYDEASIGLNHCVSSNLILILYDLIFS